MCRGAPLSKGVRHETTHRGRQHPRDHPDLLASISLAVVFFNAASGSIAYARMRRIDYRSGVYIDQIKFVTTLADGTHRTYGPWGGSGGKAHSFSTASTGGASVERCPTRR